LLGQTAAPECGAGDDPEDFCAGVEAGAPVAGDLIFAGEAEAVADGDFFETETELCGADLHFDRPAVVAVLHVELAEQAGADGAEGAEVCCVLTPNEADEAGGEPVAESLVRAESSFGSVSEDSGTDDEVGFAAKDGFDQEGSFGGIFAGVGLQEDENRVVRGLGKSGEAGGAVTSFGDGDDRCAGFASDRGCVIVGTVVSDDNLRENARRQTQQSLSDYVLLIVGGNDQPDR